MRDAIRRLLLRLGCLAFGHMPSVDGPRDQPPVWMSCMACSKRFPAP